MSNKVRNRSKAWTFIILGSCLVVLLGGAFSLYLLKGGNRITTRDIEAAEKIIGLKFTQKERKMMQDNLKTNRSNYQELRKISLPNNVPPALLFNPVVPGMSLPKEEKAGSVPENRVVKVPENIEDLAFYPVTALSQLIRERRITSTQLTRMYLERLKK